MSFYRNTYLKSEDWKALRAAKIAHVIGRCNLCGLRSESNDVHHVKYRRLYDVKLTDLRVLCRGCHDRVHELLDKYPKLKKLKSYEQWVAVRLHFNRVERYDSIRRSKIGRRTQIFGKFRNQLVSDGHVYRFRMKFSDAICIAMSESSFENPASLLSEYMMISGSDPRRSVKEKHSSEPTHTNQENQYLLAGQGLRSATLCPSNTDNDKHSAKHDAHKKIGAMVLRPQFNALPSAAL